MITTKTIYELHNVELELKLENINNELKDLEPLRQIHLKFFSENKEKYYPIKYEDIIEGKIDENDILQSTKFWKTFRINLKNYNSYIIKYNLKQKSKLELENSKVSYSIFRYILLRFAKLTISKIIKDGYILKLFPIGDFLVTPYVNKRQVIDWGESDKNKKELLKQGKIPFIKKDKEQADKEGKDYNGVPWIVYLKPQRYYFTWLFNLSPKMVSNNMRSFEFEPSRGKDSPVVHLFDYIRDKSDEELLIKYKSEYVS